jgi:hypothetical protein
MKIFIFWIQAILWLSRICVQIAQEQETIQTLKADFIEMGVGHHTSDFKKRLQQNQRRSKFFQP